MLEVKQVHKGPRVNGKLFRDNAKSTQLSAGIRVERVRIGRHAVHEAVRCDKSSQFCLVKPPAGSSPPAVVYVRGRYHCGASTGIAGISQTRAARYRI